MASSDTAEAYDKVTEKNKAAVEDDSCPVGTMSLDKKTEDTIWKTFMLVRKL